MTTPARDIDGVEFDTSHALGPLLRECDRLILVALEMARGRSRVLFEAGHQNIHSLSADAVEEVKV
jgi:metal-dependent HD superfamily phosphatase/phosphodiesterase